MNSIFQIFGEIAIDSSKANRSIDSISKNAGSLVSVIKKVGAAVATAFTVDKIKDFVSLSVNAYAEYEQLIGGVETLFKESSNKIFEYANNAYKTAGLSANEYMENVTSFSASLLQSMGGNTEAAALQADKALTDMSDNANKMGTSMSSIQYAYQGFAKQNYTMLDNLKLGYGGTKEEMERLLKDASKLAGVRFDISSFSDVIEAIHVMQEEMGIAGTTAKEATETISGSFTALKSTWTNLLTGLSDEKANIKTLYRNLNDSVKTYAKNVIKVIPGFVRNLGTLASSLWVTFKEEFAVLAEQVPDWIVGIKQKISDAWNNNVWPDVQRFAKIAFGVELPDWGLLIAYIKDGWRKVVWPSVQNWFKVNFDVVLPEWSETGSELVEWWGMASTPMLENVKQFSTDVGTFIKGIDWGSLIGAGFGISVAFRLVGISIGLLNSPLFLLATGISLLATNWNEVKEAVENAYTATVEWMTKNVGEPLENFRKNVIEPIADGWEEVVEPAIRNAIIAVDDYFGLGLVDGWNEITNAIQTAWNNVKTSIENAATAIQNFLGLNDGKGLGGGEMIDNYSYHNNPKFTGEGGHGGGAGKGFAKGLDYVPYNGLAFIHEGEAILNKTNADAWRSGAMGIGNGDIQKYVRDTVREQISAIEFNITLDTGVMAGHLAPKMDQRLGKISGYKGRGN